MQRSSESIGALAGALAKAQVPATRLHALRHFFITECFKGGASAPTVQQLAGHLHLSVTQRYAHTNDNLKKDGSLFTNHTNNETTTYYNIPS